MKERKLEEAVRKLKEKVKNPGSIALIAAGIFLFFMLLTMLSTGFISLFACGLLFGLGLAGLLGAGYWFYYSEKKIWHIPAWLLCITVVLSSVFSMEYCRMVQEGLIQMSGPRADFSQTVGIYTSTAGNQSSLDFLNGQTLGIMKDRQTQAQQEVLQELEEKNISVTLKPYPTLQSLYKAVRGQAVRAAILTPADVKIAQEFAGTAKSSSDLHQVYQTSIDTGVSVPSAADLNVRTQPYTVLISASQTPLAESSYRSTLNLVLAVNPKTREVMCTVLPRSLYVPLACSEELACYAASSNDKIGYASYSSIEALRQSAAEMLGMPIDFAVRIDLSSIARLTDLDDTVGIETGYTFAYDEQHGQTTPMNAPRVSQFIGVLGDFSAADFEQELNQLRVLVSLIRQNGRLSVLSNEKEVIDILDHSVATTFSYRQLCALIRSNILQSNQIAYQSIGGTYITAPSPALTEHSYVLDPDPASVQAAKENMQAVLDGGELAHTNIEIPQLPQDAGM